MKKNKTPPAPEQEKMDLPDVGENLNDLPRQKPENRPLEEPSSYEEAIEAILFAAGHPVSYEALAKTFDLTAPIIRTTVKEYAEKYNHSKVPRGVILLALDELPKGVHLRFDVRPIECFGKKGRPISSDGTFVA